MHRGNKGRTRDPGMRNKVGISVPSLGSKPKSRQRQTRHGPLILQITEGNAVRRSKGGSNQSQKFLHRDIERCVVRVTLQKKLRAVRKTFPSLFVTHAHAQWWHVPSGCAIRMPLGVEAAANTGLWSRGRPVTVASAYTSPAAVL